MFEAAARLVNRARPGREMLGHFLTTSLLRAGQLLLPGTCSLCGGQAQWHRCRGGLDLCGHCEAALPRAGGAVTVPGCDLVHAAFEFRPPADFMVRQLKFAGARWFARVLGMLLAESRAAACPTLPDALVPVPLHLARLRERGYNQAAELALFAGRTLRVPVWRDRLLRHRETAAQSALPAGARAGNVRNCFAMARPLPRGCRVALVDDVLTTGSTVAEAVRVLRAAGAARVEVWVACRAGAPSGAYRNSLSATKGLERRSSPNVDMGP